MKKAITLFLMLFSITLSAQQSDSSLLRPGLSWTMLYEYVIPLNYGPMYSYEEIKLEGDTLIDGIPFKRKHHRGWYAGEPKPQEWKVSNEFLGQSGGKVYLYFLSSRNRQTHPVMNMDFTASVGDVISISDLIYPDDTTFDYTVKAVYDTLFVNGSDDNTARRCLEVRNEEEYEHDVWIEGIGSLHCGVLSTIPFTGSIYHLYRCTEGDRILYQYEHTPTAIRETTRSDTHVETKTTPLVFDLQGRRCNSKIGISNYKKGVYIQNGRKVVG